MEFIVHLFKESSFLGALLGALITGGLALYINKFQQNKNEERELLDSKKVLLIFHYYSKVMINSFNKIQSNYEEYENLYNPFDDIEVFEDEKGYEHLSSPPDILFDIYKSETAPHLKVIKKESESILKEFEKVNSLNIYSLKLKELDVVLNFLNNFNSTVAPKLIDNIKLDYPYITPQERDAINKIFESINIYTKNK